MLNQAPTTAGRTQRESYNHSYSRLSCFFHFMVKGDAVQCVLHVKALLINKMGLSFCQEDPALGHAVHIC